MRHYLRQIGVIQVQFSLDRLVFDKGMAKYRPISPSIWTLYLVPYQTPCNVNFAL